MAAGAKFRRRLGFPYMRLVAAGAILVLCGGRIFDVGLVASVTCLLRA